MTVSIELLFIIVSVIALLSVLFSKVSERFGIPILLVFLAIGMLAGSEGIGGIYFDDPQLTQWISTIALAIILFSGGVDTEWTGTRKILKEGLALATAGVFITAAIVGTFSYWILKLPLLESLLVGAIASSTDAAAVFSLLRSSGIGLKGRLKSLLEFESGSNDPMAIFLTIGLIQLITNQNAQYTDLFLLFVLQMGVGALTGWLMSRLALYLINRLKLGYEGLYPVLTFALVFLTFGIAAMMKGSGYLAVYVLGLLLGKEDFLHKRSLIRFFDGNAWLMQIVLFVTLGLLVFPSRLVPVIVPGLLIALVLMFIARPVAVFLTLIPFHYSLREKVFISWVGLKGAVPIVLATFALVAGLKDSALLFNLVFFIVLTSVLLQGTLLPRVARTLKVDEPLIPRPFLPLEVVSGHKISGSIKELTVPQGSWAEGKAIYELKLPPEYLVILIQRDAEYIQPNGSTEIKTGDKLLSLSNDATYQEASEILKRKSFEPPKTGSG